MKPLIYLFIFSTIFFSCSDPVEGPPGPRGPQGPPGYDGKDGELASTFEYTIDFVAPKYEVFIDLPGNFTMYEDDVIQVYLLWEVKDGKDVWRALPQSILFDEGFFQYNYDFTTVDVKLFLDAEFPISNIGSEYLFDQVVRIVVIPAKFFNNPEVNLDLSDYNAVEKYFNIQEISVDRQIIR